MHKKCMSSDYYFSAMQIHAICVDEGIDDAIIRLLTYIHVKISENGNNIDYFEVAPPRECESIEIMLGLSGFKIQSNDSSEESDKWMVTARTFFKNLPGQIQNLDRKINTVYGTENRLYNELNDRLRLYRDETFRREIVDIYKNIILPRLDLYESVTIERAFRQAREKQR